MPAVTSTVHYGRSRSVNVWLQRLRFEKDHMRNRRLFLSHRRFWMFKFGGFILFFVFIFLFVRWVYLIRRIIKMTASVSAPKRESDCIKKRLGALLLLLSFFSSIFNFWKNFFLFSLILLGFFLVRESSIWWRFRGTKASPSSAELLLSLKYLGFGCCWFRFEQFEWGLKP